MIIQTVLVSVCLAVSLLNLVSTIFLSNFVFRLLVAERRTPGKPPETEKGLVDPGYSPTYDPRFRE